MMNSLYGKFGETLDRELTNQITDDDDLLLKLFQTGKLYDVKPLNDRYVSYSGLQETNQKNCNTNFFIAAYITARGRINLHKPIMDI